MSRTPGQKAANALKAIGGRFRASLRHPAKGSESADEESVPPLQEKILARLVYCQFDKKDFLPQSSLDELITTESIEEELRSAGLAMLSADIFKNARKVFTVLVYIGMVGAMESLHGEGFADEYLPVELVSKRDGYTMVSRQNSRRSEKIFRSFNRDPWNSMKRKAFLDYQWLVQSPVFESGQHYSLDTHCILPFISDARQIARSYFSKVFEVQVHPAHQHVFRTPRVSMV